ncbi:MAG: enoyl-CoA hydratase/isomerase family protein [Thermoleophilia bacterium]
MPAEPPPAPALVTAVDGPALVLRMCNPARANAVDDGILDAITAAVQAPPPGVRCVLLGGDGDRHFSAGLDLGDVEGDALAARLRDGERRLGVATAAIAACPVPVVAVIGGAAFGGALELAIACDWRLAADTAKLAMPAARLGVVYAPEGLRRFVACLGPARARELFLTGRPADAARALEIGLVDRVVPHAELWEAAMQAAADIALAGPTAVAGTRAAIDALAGPLDPAARDAVDGLRERAYASPEFAEGLAAFRGKRPPDWSGFTASGGPAGPPEG